MRGSKPRAGVVADRQIRVRCTPQEDMRFRAAARVRGMTLSQLVRHLLELEETRQRISRKEK